MREVGRVLEVWWLANYLDNREGIMSLCVMVWYTGCFEVSMYALWYRILSTSSKR